MSEQLAPGQQDKVATYLGWAIFITFFILFFNIINLPRTPLGQREGMQLWHDSLGWIVGALCWIRLYWFAKVFDFCPYDSGDGQGNDINIECTVYRHCTPKKQQRAVVHCCV